jgi:hypothetical protein
MRRLDVYIHDYLVKRNLQATADAFISEGKVATDPVAIDAPGGFLFEWWSIFWDIFHSTSTTKSSSSSVSLNNSPMMPPGINSSDASAVKMMMHERLRHPNSDHHHLLDTNTRMTLLTKSPPQSHSGYMFLSFPLLLITTNNAHSLHNYFQGTTYAAADSPKEPAATGKRILRPLF